MTWLRTRRQSSYTSGQFQNFPAYNTDNKGNLFPAIAGPIVTPFARLPVGSRGVLFCLMAGRHLKPDTMPVAVQAPTTAPHSIWQLVLIASYYARYKVSKMTYPNFKSHNQENFCVYSRSTIIKRHFTYISPDYKFKNIIYEARHWLFVRIISQF